MGLQTTIWVRTSFIGFHYWEGAPEEVEYLRSPHRHLFKVVLEVPVSHDNRQTEFHQLKSQLDTFLQDSFTAHVVPYSCEQIAKQVQLVFGASSVSVSEDGECGATVREN